MTHCEQIEMLGYPLHFWSSSSITKKSCLHNGARHRGTRSIRVCLLASTSFCGEKTIFEEKARECVHYWVLQPGGLGAGNSFALKLQCYSCFFEQLFEFALKLQCHLWFVFFHNDLNLQYTLTPFLQQDAHAINAIEAHYLFYLHSSSSLASVMHQRKERCGFVDEIVSSRWKEPLLWNRPTRLQGASALKWAQKRVLHWEWPLLAQAPVALFRWEWHRREIPFHRSQNAHWR